MRLVKSTVDNQDVEKSYIGGHKVQHKVSQSNTKVDKT